MKNATGLFVFGMVGAIGFVIDAGILTLLSQTFEINVYVSRIFSFTAATLVTWLLNRWLVFRVGAVNAEQKRQEYGRYFLVQSGGALLNLGVFSILIAAFPPLKTIPVIPLAVGAVFGLAFNYSGARFWVFKKSLLERP